MFEDQKIEEQRIVPTLSDKVKELIKKYQDVVAQNESLRNELVALKSQNDTLSLELGKLEEDIVVKNITEEELFKEIEDILQK